MLDRYCSDLHASSSQHSFLAERTSHTRPFISQGRCLTPSGHRAASRIVKCAGLSQQGISSLIANVSSPSAAIQAQHLHCGPLHRLQALAVSKQRDVRAYIRAPVIPALESQPYREGSGKPSKIQAGSSLSWNEAFSELCISGIYRKRLRKPAKDSPGADQLRATKH